MRILVTGATGTIGRRLVPLLCDQGHQVHVIGRTKHPEPRAVCHQLDLLHGSALLADLLRRIEASHAVHLAWYTEPRRYWAAPENIDWLAGSLLFARRFTEAGGSRLVVAGTCAEYDWTHGGVLDEFESPLSPSTLYGYSKLNLYRILSDRSADLGLSLAWGRIFFPFASDEHPPRLLGTLLAASRSGEPARFSSGIQERDFISVTDVAGALSAMLQTEVTGPVNVSSGSAIRVRDFIETAAGLIGRNLQLEFGPLPLDADEPLSFSGANERLKTEVGYAPQHDISSGLAAAIREAEL